MFQGTLSAIVTPFHEAKEQFAVDYASLERLVDWQIQMGVDGIVVCGSTGEAATLSTDEKLSVIQRTVEYVRGRIPVIAGTGTNDTKASVEFTTAVRALKIQGVLAVTPYYNKPTQEGLYQHFRAIAAVGLPVVVYNIPGRSVTEISLETFKRLADVPNIAAVKQAVDSISKLLELADAVADKVAILAGDDPITHSVMTMGGKGVISASATVIPKEMKAITSAALSGDYAQAFRAQRNAIPFIQALFRETNPIPAKAALKILGHIDSDALRLPLTTATDDTKAALRKIFVR